MNTRQAKHTTIDTKQYLRSFLNAPSYRRIRAKLMSYRKSDLVLSRDEVDMSQSTKLSSPGVKRGGAMHKAVEFPPHRESSNESHSRKSSADQSRPECLVLIMQGTCNLG